MAATLSLPMTITEVVPTPASRWSLRLALLAGAVILAAGVGHRFAGMSTPVALNLFKVGFAGAGVALFAAMIALFQIWRHDARGVLATTGAVAIALSIFAWPLVYIEPLRTLPMLNDVSTDVRSPPAFDSLNAFRVGSANPAAYPGAGAAQLQTAAYPDIRSFDITRSAEETFELAYRVAARIFKMQIVSEVPPGAKPGQPGRIEAIDRTTVLGFYDDVVIRITGDQSRSRIDIRSASRFGQHDLGRNASRVRRFLREMQAQLDFTVPTTSGERIARMRDRLGRRIAVPRRGTAGDRDPADPRSSQAPARSDAQRGPEQKVRLRARDERQSRDTRPPPPAR